ncbi:MAG: GTP cyclohydrolase II [Anaerolineae bacterium]
MSQFTVEKMTDARIPTDQGEFRLALYHNNYDQKEHLALVMGKVNDRESVLVRVHSECFTGDTLGSLRCDCGQQLAEAMRLIAEEGRGVLIYLRQEGRGIGLLNKLRAYNLQDMGYDTVDANLMLGHQADARDYTVAALILADLGVSSLRLMTNNPSKMESLERLGMKVTARVPLPPQVNRENAAYLTAKVKRMRHLLSLAPVDSSVPLNGRAARPPLRPFVTLSYAQSLDGSISTRRGEPTAISGPESLTMTHKLRAAHDAILVGIGTVLADNPRLNVRLVEGPDPQPIVVDSHLRFPPNARLAESQTRPVWIAATEQADTGRQQALEAAGLRVLRLPADPDGRVNLAALLSRLAQMGVDSLMVEGGARIITSFLKAHLVDRLVLTVAPKLLGGLNAIGSLGHVNGNGLPYLHNPRYQWLGEDMVLTGDVIWGNE